MEKGYYSDEKSIGSTWQNGLLILLYHAIERPPLRYPWRGLYVTPAKLRSQLEGLRRAGFSFLSLTESMGRTGSGRVAAITFDDAFRSVFVNGLPVLQALGVSAVTFVVTERIGDFNRWDLAAGGQQRPLMNREEILAWARAGQEIGSHGMTHADLTRLPLAEARREIFESKKILEDILGTSVRHFCYPYGNQNEALRELVREAGYETACGTGMGFNTPPSANPFNLDRVLARHRFPFAAALLG